MNEAEQGRPDEDAPSTVGETTEIVAAHDLETWIAERRAIREAQHAHRRAWLGQANTEHREARQYGLKARQALALNRRRKGTML
jgi:poly(3-hydroxyalkanoate) synthetase